LEGEGFLQEAPDRCQLVERKVLVEATDKTHDLIRENYGPTALAGAELLVQIGHKPIVFEARNKPATTSEGCS
jgi:hypothetical protein